MEMKLFIKTIFCAWIVSLLVSCGPQPVETAIGLPPQEALAPHLETLCLIVEERYGGDHNQELSDVPSQPIAEGVERILAGIGMNVAAPGEPCEATLTITVNCEARGAQYQRDDGLGYERCYTGSRCHVHGVLVQQGQEDIEVFMVGEHDPPSEIHSCPYEKDAPFGEAWSEALIYDLAYLWGPELLANNRAEDLVPTPYKEPALPMP